MAAQANQKEKGFGVLPETGFVRQSQLIPAILPISSATFWRWIKAGTFPQPSKLSAGVTAFRAEDVRAWLDAQGAKR